MEMTPGGDRNGALAAFGIQAGPNTGDEIAIRQPVIRIGSASQNELVIADDSVSTTHARLEFDDGAWRLTDLRSTNGTYVEGVRLAPEVPTPLPYGSSVRFGGARLHFRPVEAANPEAARAEYVEPAAATRLIDERTGFRLPIWLLVLLIIVIGLLVYFFGWVWTGPETLPTTAAFAAPLLLPPPGPA